jgi:hypothetical protein
MGKERVSWWQGDVTCCLVICVQTDKTHGTQFFRKGEKEGGCGMGVLEALMLRNS